jgi:CRP/FNR family cyclic AMP-dependent transcriptional regulator
MADLDFKLLANAPSRSFNAGETIFQEGDPATESYVVKNGSLQIRIGDRLVETLSDAGIFGEMALIDDLPRSATAVVQTDVDLVPVNQKRFLFLVCETPFFALNVMRALANRLRTQTSV